jgi:hypothetical protein
VAIEEPADGDVLTYNSTNNIWENSQITGIPGTEGPEGPEGPQGPAGPANTLTVGTVVDSEPGSEPEVTITGTAPNQVINFVLPTGATGPAGEDGTGGGGGAEISVTAPITNSGTSLEANIGIDQTALGITASQITDLGTGIEDFLKTPTSANLATAITNETGTGNLVFSASPTITGTLTTSAINSGAIVATGNVNPQATNTYDLGTSFLRWRNVFTQDLHLSNGIGDYTIVEGEEELYLINNKNQKHFKFALIQVDPSEVPAKSDI